MKHLGLNQSELEQLTVSDWWGIQKCSTKDIHLFQQIQEFERRADFHQTCKNILNFLAQKNRFVQWIYWIFNINQFRSNYYKLAALLSWKLYKEDDKMWTNWFSKSNNNPSSEQENAQSMLNYFSSKISNLFVRTPEKIAKHEPEFFEPHEAPKNQQPASHEPPIIKQNIEIRLVRASLLEHLNTLGFNLKIGQPINKRELTQAYRKLSIIHHPDKNQDQDGTLFVAINEAYQKLCNHFESDDEDDLVNLIQDLDLDFKQKITTLHEEATALTHAYVESVQKNSKFEKIFQALSIQIDSTREDLQYKKHMLDLVERKILTKEQAEKSIPEDFPVLEAKIAALEIERQKLASEKAEYQSNLPNFDLRQKQIEVEKKQLKADYEISRKELLQQLRQNSMTSFGFFDQNESSSTAAQASATCASSL